MTALLDITTTITDALLPVVSGVKGVALRGRRTPLPQGQKAGIRVNSRRHAIQSFDLSASSVAVQSTVMVELLVRGTDTTDAEAALDTYLGPLWAALAALPTPPNSNGFTTDGVIDLDIDEADATVAVASVSLVIQQITSAAGLTG